VDVGALREAVAATGLLAPGARVLALLSGGRDSVCLLDVAVALCGSDSVTALHVNYGLRVEADADERHCATLCGQLGVELLIERAEQAAEGARGNLQAWARELRYDAAGAWAEEHDALFASGHTASDQVETILYRLAASPGRRALLGMVASEGRLVRPLLSITREQTAAYCRQRRLGWREDASNDSEQFARARVRHGLVPALGAVHPAAESNVLRTAELLREEGEVLDRLIADQLRGRSLIALDELAALPVALARLLIIRLAEDVAGTYVPQAGARVSEILALGAHGGSAQLHVGGGVAAVVQGGMLEMVSLPPRGRDRTPPEV
jgi:tRNA(Ile)-lysidine synthase